MNPLQQQQAVYKTGVVSAVDEESVTARVRFADLDDLETAFIPVGQRKTLKDKDYWLPDEGEHVACLMDMNAEDGVILCAIYSDADMPPVSSRDKRHIRFRDGATFEYDRASHELNINTPGPIHVRTKGPVILESEGTVMIETQADAKVRVHGNAEVRIDGWGQVIASGRLLIKSLTALILKGPSRELHL